MKLLAERDWRNENYLSHAGIYYPKKEIGDSSLPAALMQYLKDFPQIKEISLHLDNDMPGRQAAKTLKVLLSPIYTVSDEPPEHGKDYNDYLENILRTRQPRVRE